MAGLRTTSPRRSMNSLNSPGEWGWPDCQGGLRIMRIGIGIGWGPSAVERSSAGLRRGLQAWVDNLHLAEDSGFEVIGFGDSQSIEPELYTMMAVAARETTRAWLVPMATNPVTRHPAVAAAAIASADALSAGRARLGLGRGNSAVHNLGERPASTELLRGYLLAVRELLNGRSTTWQGKPIRAD